MSSSTGKPDMFTQLYLSHANKTITELVENGKSYKISRRKIELQILEEIDKSQFPTAFRIVFYSMVLNSSNFDVYWFGRQDMHDLSNTAITRLRPNMSLLRNLNTLDTFDASSASDDSDTSGNGDAQDVIMGPVEDSNLDEGTRASRCDGAADLAPSLMNRDHLSNRQQSAAPPDSGGLVRPSPKSKAPAARKTTCSRGKQSSAPPKNHTDKTGHEIIHVNPFEGQIIESGYIDPSLITSSPNFFMDSMPGTSSISPTQVDTPATTVPSSPIPGPGGLKSKSALKGKRAVGPKKQATKRPARTTKARTGGKKATGVISGTGAGLGKGKGKGAGGKGKGKSI